MEDFIVRIYRFEKDNPRALVGLVEKIGEKGRKGFTNLDELWEIMNSSIRDPGRIPSSGSSRPRGTPSSDWQNRGSQETVKLRRDSVANRMEISCMAAPG